jgi:carbon catabolite-derepressing protein kinase
MEQRDRDKRARNELLEQRRQEAAQCTGCRGLFFGRHIPIGRSVSLWVKLGGFLTTLLEQFVASSFIPPTGQPLEKQPKRSRKWQFGIRSRNQPYEAMLYLYRAIAAQGGLWDIQPVEWM